MYEKTRFVSGVSSAPPMQDGVGALRRRARGPRGRATSACIVSASTRLPRQRADGGVGGGLHLLVLELEAVRRGAPRRAAPATESWCSSRNGGGGRWRAAGSPPRRRRGSASPETCSTPSMSSRIAAMTGSESIRVTKSVAVPAAEIELRTSRSSGPGGQHAQKSETRVEAVFDVEASSALTEAQKRRVVAKAGPGAPRGRAGRAQPATEPRARHRATRRRRCGRPSSSRGGASPRSPRLPRRRGASTTRSAAAR